MVVSSSSGARDPSMSEHQGKERGNTIFASYTFLSRRNYSPVTILSAFFAMLVVIDALSHVIMGHQWTYETYLVTIVKYAAKGWPLIEKAEYLANVPNASEWAFPAGEAATSGVKIFPFTPILWDVFVVFPRLPITIATHCLCGTSALVTGWMQVFALSSIPRTVHRALSWIYATSFTVTALTGAILGANDSSGELGKWNFFAMALFAIAPTWMGVISAVRGDFASHREWMLRSFAVCFSVSVLLRLSFLWVVPVMMGGNRLHEGDYDSNDAYMVLVFLSWSLPLLAVDIWLTMTKGRKVIYPGVDTAVVGDKNKMKEM